MEEIITDLRMHPALLNELCSGRKYREATLRAREQACAREAAAARGHKTIPGLGKLVLTIPEDEYYDIGNKYGFEAFDDRGFIRDMQRLEPDLATHKV